MKYLLLTLFAWGLGNDWVGNGANLSESRIFMAYENLEIYLGASLKDTKRPLMENERALVSKIMESLPRERRLNPQMIRLMPHSSMFIIDGQAKVAVTGLTPGDPIYINKDFLQRFDEQNHLVDMSLLEAVSILVHELGHHQGLRDHSYLDRVGAMVADVSRYDEHWMPLLHGDQSIGAQFLVPRTPWLSSTALHFIDAEKHWDVQSEIQKLNVCDRHLPGSEMKNVTLWNVYWTSRNFKWVLAFPKHPESRSQKAS